jgi:hypothetical protein
MSGRLAVALLSDGRLQLWAVGPTTHTLFSMWQESVIPTEPWTSLRLFNPNPSAVPDTTGDGRILARRSCPTLGPRLFSGTGGAGDLRDDDNLEGNTRSQCRMAPVATVRHPFYYSGSGRCWTTCASDGTLQTIQKTSTDASSGWTAWQPFLPSPGSIMDVTVGTLKNGACQIFVIAATAQGSVQVLTSRQNRSGNPKNTRLHFWTDWVSIGTLS